LKNGGLFLFADYRSKNKFSELRKAIESASFEVVKGECINRQVVSALQLDWDRKCQVYKELVPGFLHNVGLNYAYKIRSELIGKFGSDRKIYFNFILQKQPV
jgi:hypothetical protein